MFRLLAVLAMLSTWVNEAHSSPNDSIKVLPDSSNFVTASLVIAEPLHALYSVFGHATLRMECPSYGLDYVFTFESDPNFNTFMTGIAGKAKAKYIAVLTDTFINDTKKMGRGLKQYKLNLTHHEKQELWRLLDEEMMAGAYRNFNLLFTNCLTTSILNMQRCLIDEHFEWGALEYPQTLNDGELFRHAVRHSPWAEFLFITFGGTAYDRRSIQEYRLTPETVIPMLRKATITNDSTGVSRFVITDPGMTLVESSGKDKATPITPNIVFGGLLLLTLLITLAERVLHWHQVAKVYDILLFTAQLLVSLLMLYVTFFSEMFVTQWNWYLVVFLPLPLVFWQIRNKKMTSRCWLGYSLALVLFILSTPFIGILDWTHQLITGSLLIRSISNYFKDKKYYMKKDCYLPKGYLHRWLCTIMLLAVSLLTVTATSTYYYKVTATATPNGYGKVYVSRNSTNNPNYQNTSTSSGNVDYVGRPSLNFKFYAQAKDENYIFSHWASGSANGTHVSTNTSFNTDLEISSTSNGSPTTYNYYAVFIAQQGLIKVMSADESKGSVSISNPNNIEDEEVTLTANPDVTNGVLFLGWKKNKNNTGEYISTENPLVLTVNNSTKGTYYAYFSNPQEKAYIRLQNKKTGRFLCIYGNQQATVHNRTIDGRTRQDGFTFTNSLKLIAKDEAQGNPATVFLRAGNPSGSGVTIGGDLTAHGVSYKTHLVKNNNYVLTMVNTDKGIRIYTNFTYSGVTFSSYLCDEGGSTQYAVMKSFGGNDDDAATYWSLYSLDDVTTEGAFGANAKAKFTKDGMFYTTMYTDFPYKLLDGVNAYYLTIPEGGMEELEEEFDHHNVVFMQVTGGKVPANMAVILECPVVQNDINSTPIVTNRLQPLTESVAQIVDQGLNFLKGYISLNNIKQTNDKKRMYVLSTNPDNGVLGFYHSTATNMTPNKAYLLAPEVSDEEEAYYAKKLTFSFGFPEDNLENETPTGIELSDLMVDEDDSTPVYNLNGSKVATGKAAEKMLRPGVYVKKGKKFVVN